MFNTFQVETGGMVGKPGIEDQTLGIATWKEKSVRLSEVSYMACASEPSYFHESSIAPPL
jgi:hypothetical protein